MYKISFKNIGVHKKNFEIRTENIDTNIISKAIAPYLPSNLEIKLSADKEGEYAIITRKGFCYMGEYKINKVLSL